MTDTLREKVARAIATDIGLQDNGEKFILGADLTLAYLDQGEVDFGKVADAAIASVLEALQTPTEAMLEAGVDAYRKHVNAGPMWQSMLTAFQQEQSQ